jgi:hypothetical protein
MSNVSLAGTPMEAKPSTYSSNNELLDKKMTFPFAKLIGKLVYHSNCTKPDITMAVNHLSRYMTFATVRLWEQGKRVLRHLSSTLQHSFIFNGRSRRGTPYGRTNQYGDTTHVQNPSQIQPRYRTV